MSKKLVCFFTIAILLNMNYLLAQYQRVEQEKMFVSKIENPIRIEPLSQGDKYLFQATNRSFYPYQLSIHFIELRNLIPEIMYRNFIVLPGENRLFTLTIKDKTAGHSYKYGFSFKIGAPSKNVVFDYPYLVPLGVTSTFELVNNSENSGIYIQDFFKVKSGDTIFNMRKGYIAAVPDMFHDADRISSGKSLEVIHKDGTIMIYENIDPEKVLVKIGTTVFPGEPLGIINDESILNLFLYMVQKDGRLKNLEIKYSISTNKVEPFSEKLRDVKFERPQEIITREMSKREIKKHLLN